MPLQSITTLQLLIFGAGWLLAAWLVREHRAAPRHWAAYCLLQASQVLFVGLPPMWARVAIAPLFIGGFLLAIRGIEVFVAGRSTRDKLWLALAALVCSAVAAAPFLPLAPALQRGLQITVLYGSATLLLLGTVPWLWRLVGARYGQGVAFVAVLPNVLVGTVQGGLTFWETFVGPLRQTLGPDLALGLSIGISAAATTLFNLCMLFVFVAELVQRLRHTATHDHLTGAANRRAGEAALTAALDRHRRDGQGLAVLAIDLDHFKRVNDERGHAAGDRALVFTAEVLRKATRSYDTVVRWGGEEFVVVLPGAPHAPAVELAERIRAQIETRAPAVLGHALTASIGVASAEAIDTESDPLMARADRALYRAKEEGRNRVCVGTSADAPLLTPEPAPVPVAAPLPTLTLH